MSHSGRTIVTGVPTSLQNMIKSDDVGGNIGIRMVNGISNPCLCRQVHHHSGLCP